jgi:hypothetical protein
MVFHFKILLASFLLLLTPSVYANEDVIMPVLENPVRLDGAWSNTTEWNESAEIKIDNGKAYVLLKQDERFVYVMIDYLADQGLDRSGDWNVACFDINNDSGIPDEDDYCFYIATRSGKMRSGIMQGSDDGWVVIQESRLLEKFARIGSSYLHDPYEKSKHVVSEFRIPITHKEMGFYVYANDGYRNEFVEWPENAGGKKFGVGSPTIRDVLASPADWGAVKKSG